MSHLTTDVARALVKSLDIPSILVLRSVGGFQSEENESAHGRFSCARKYAWSQKSVNYGRRGLS